MAAISGVKNLLSAAMEEGQGGQGEGCGGGEAGGFVEGEAQAVGLLAVEEGQVLFAPRQDELERQRDATVGAADVDLTAKP